MVCTPDLDIYVEDVAEPTLDVGWSAISDTGGLPRSVAGMAV